MCTVYMCICAHIYVTFREGDKLDILGLKEGERPILFNKLCVLWRGILDREGDPNAYVLTSSKALHKSLLMESIFR